MTHWVAPDGTLAPECPADFTLAQRESWFNWLRSQGYRQVRKAVLA